ncbi:hypothetical protein Vretimale_9471 [Volvox reticuliferus]|uniref:Uncharacterized protein n=1 Tax=Volvox reticuliferus TaxID=1737510 RepID=A0A8J4FVQ3_9CHLO|nr:hypothetical protein Vretifemale_18707 [Volvox reticuliferus]GIM04996.1 hypothetical protein Vretimale_9471 [Volvox reticuliferus]
MTTITGKVLSGLTASRPIKAVPISRNRNNWQAQPCTLHNVSNQMRSSTRTYSKRATEEDEKLIEEMKRAAEKGDLLESSAVDALVKVLAVSAAVGVVVVLAYLAQPVIQNTVASFPTAS